MTNSELRQIIIKKRRQLSLEYRIEASDKILDELIGLDEYKQADRILIYADANGEVSTDKLILTSLLAGKKVYAPVCGSDYSMEFYQIFALEELYPASYGIREPLTIEELRLTEAVIDDNTLIIVPGVAFDCHSNRMGYGKGYYDRYLAKNTIRHRIALAYEFQLVDSLETKETDIPMTKILTN